MFNPGAESLLGYGSEEMLGKPVAALIPEELREEAASLSNRVLEVHTVTGLRVSGSLRQGGVFRGDNHEFAGR